MSEQGWISDDAAKIGSGAANRYVKPKDWPVVKGGAKQQQIRILSSAFGFYEGWSGGKPVRSQTEDGFTPGIVWDMDSKFGPPRPRTPAKQWGVYAVYADAPGEILFWQISQYSIQQALLDLAYGPKGSPTKYDVIVTYREKAKPPYSVQALDSSPVSPEAEKAYADLLAAGANLEGILTSEGPFPRSVPATPSLVPPTNAVPF